MKELKKISIIWGLLLLVIFALLTFFALKWKAKTTPYFKLEEELVTKTKSYYEMKHSYPTNGNYTIITYQELKESNMIDELKTNNDTCDGYVKVENKGVIDYKGFVKCSNYTTKDYDKYLNK